jgi:hypothetical protein
LPHKKMSELSTLHRVSLSPAPAQLASSTITSWRVLLPGLRKIVVPASLCVTTKSPGGYVIFQCDRP